MDSQNDLFPEGWREPGDDIQRLAYYVLMAVGAIGGLFGAGWMAFAKGAGHFHPLARIALGLACLGISGAVAWFFKRESKTWQIGFTAEKVIAGGFELGIAFIFLGFLFNRFAGYGSGQGAGLVRIGIFGTCFAIGAVICLITLIVGVGCALWDKFGWAVTYSNVMVEERYALMTRWTGLMGTLVLGRSA
jgi:hypothetical protein